MRMICKRRLWSLVGSYEFYDEFDRLLYTAKGKFKHGRYFEIYDSDMKKVAVIKQRLFRIMYCFDVYMNDEYIGKIKRKFRPIDLKYVFDYKKWSASVIKLHTEVLDCNGNTTVDILLDQGHLTENYIVDVADEKDTIYAAMITSVFDSVTTFFG